MTGYHRPETLDQVLDLLQQPDVRVAAGCTDLFPATEAPMLAGSVVDVTAVPELRGVSENSTGLRIGATTTWSDLIRANLPPACNMLKEAAREVGSTQIQNAGTIAGNICNASPAADGVPCLMALDATVEIAGQAGKRSVPLQDFLVGARQTALKASEVVTAIHLPASALKGVSRFRKLGARKYLVISIAMVAARVSIVNRRIEDAAIAVGSCSAVARRLPMIETSLCGKLVDHTVMDVIDDAEVEKALSPIADIRASSSYRNSAAAELIRRAVEDVISQEVPA